MEKKKGKERGREGARVPESLSFHSGELPGNKVERDSKLLIYGVVRLVWHKRPDTPMVDDENSGPSWDLGNIHLETGKAKLSLEPVGGSRPHGHLEDGGPRRESGSSPRGWEQGALPTASPPPNTLPRSHSAILGTHRHTPPSRPRIHRSARSPICPSGRGPPHGTLVWATKCFRMTRFPSGVVSHVTAASDTTGVYPAGGATRPPPRSTPSPTALSFPTALSIPGEERVGMGPRTPKTSQWLSESTCWFWQLWYKKYTGLEPSICESVRPGFGHLWVS